MDKDSKERVKRENTERRRKKRWKVSLNFPSYTVELRGTERRGALEPWRRCQCSTGASQFNDPIMMS